MATDYGRWSEPGFPHKGWEFVSVEDLEDLIGSCEMCGTEIRYVHHLWHPDKEESVAVGCVCAENLTEDRVTPKAREKEVKSRSARNIRWLRREWNPSEKGFTLKALGFRMTVFQIRKVPYFGMWGYFVGNVRGRAPCRTLNGAKVACRDLIEQLKRSGGVP